MYLEQLSDLLVIRQHGGAASEGLDDRTGGLRVEAADVL
jgi:hypothetical protein